MPTKVKVLLGVSLACGVLAIAAWIAALVLWPEQALEITENLFYRLLAPLAVGLVSGVTSGLVVAMMLESKRGPKSDPATGSPSPGAAPSPAAKETE